MSVYCHSTGVGSDKITEQLLLIIKKKREEGITTDYPGPWRPCREPLD